MSAPEHLSPSGWNTWDVTAADGSVVQTIVDADVVINKPLRVVGNGYVKMGRHYLHRLIAGTPIGRDTDHINLDKLDNRRQNLRIATRAENNANSEGRPSRRKGRYKGIAPTRHGRWSAYITHQGRSMYLGTYGTEREASDAYQVKARELWGEHNHADS